MEAPTSRARPARRWLQDFVEGAAEQRDLLGGKGANLAEMTRMGLPVPPGFTVTTDACRAYLADEGRLPEGLEEQITAAVGRLEDARGKRLGDPDDPLLLSVRSGARFSMPGMMDTVLDLGLNPTTVKGLARASGDERFAVDSWRRFTEMFSTVVLGVPHALTDAVRADHLRNAAVDDASALSAPDGEALVAALREAAEQHTGQPFPDEPMAQLMASVEAVFRSWNGRRARDYRRLEHIPDDLGTAVNVQSMVFGNLGEGSGSGVVFTRDPATGSNAPYGDWLRGAQGEDVVAGVRNTEPFAALREAFPEPYVELVDVFARLERRYGDMCDIEFTIEQGQLWVLQTRVGKRSALAALRMAVEMADEGLIERDDAVLRVRPEDLERLLHPTFDPAADRTVLATGLGASPGAASGRVCFTADEAETRAADGQHVLLVRPETSPDDLHGIVAAQGVLTSRGGLVSHAAVVARSIGKPAVCGVDALQIDLVGRRFTVGDTVVHDGDVVSIDGTLGQVVQGEVTVVEPDETAELGRLLAWADERRRLGVRANADTAEDARRARSLGAEGIGLCRTEHQFLGDRLPVLQAAILARTDDDRAVALDGLHAQQRDDFVGLLEAMDGLPVTIRLLDPPLHEFLPDVEELRIRQATGEADPGERQLLEAAERWREHNPMLGVRGVRLAVLLPDLYRMQVRALVGAALERRRAGGDPQVQIMVPLTVAAAEVRYAVDDVRQTIARVLEDEEARELDVRVGTMIETPRAALVAGTFADDVDFCSFGTNDLTQMTFGFSRDDVEARLMPRYLELGLLPGDPFASLDTEGVGSLVAQAVSALHAASTPVESGVCGEHGGDPASVEFFHAAGLEYVSCSPFRLPVARLAAAQAALRSDD